MLWTGLVLEPEVGSPWWRAYGCAHGCAHDCAQARRPQQKQTEIRARAETGCAASTPYANSTRRGCKCMMRRVRAPRRRRGFPDVVEADARQLLIGSVPCGPLRLGACERIIGVPPGGPEATELQPPLRVLLALCPFRDAGALLLQVVSGVVFTVRAVTAAQDTGLTSRGRLQWNKARRGPPDRTGP